MPIKASIPPIGTQDESATCDIMFEVHVKRCGVVLNYLAGLCTQRSCTQHPPQNICTAPEKLEGVIARYLRELAVLVPVLPQANIHAVQR